MANLLVTMLNKIDVSADRIGDSTGSLTHLLKLRTLESEL